MNQILNDLMPRFDVRERHGIRVAATAERAYAACRTADLTSGIVPRLLMTLRGMSGRRRTTRVPDLERFGFTVVAEDAPRELVIGLMGKFWTPGGALCERVSVEDFRRGPSPGNALAGWNFSVERLGDADCVVRTETRVLCAADARTKFRFYWMVIRPGSGLIRRSMLAAIKRTAEA